MLETARIIMLLLRKKGRSILQLLLLCSYMFHPLIPFPKLQPLVSSTRFLLVRLRHFPPEMQANESRKERRGEERRGGEGRGDEMK